MRRRNYNYSVVSLSKLNPARVPELIERAHERLQRVQIECLPYEEILKRYDRPTTLFYLDPPYFGLKLYNFNFTEADFANIRSDLPRLPAVCRGVLSAKIPDDPGYFGEQLTAARNEVTRIWVRRSKNRVPRSRYTDVFGAFLLAGEIFWNQSDGNRKVLVVLSDMRHHTSELDLESPVVVPEFSRVAGKVKDLEPDLRGVGVCIEGVDGVGKSISYWNGLRAFWHRYLDETHAEVEAYSTLREVSKLVGSLAQGDHH